MQSLSLSQWENRFEQWLTAQDHVDAAHDISHIKRVVKTARQLAQAEEAELAVVIPAAWLHDCVAVAKDDPRRRQASAQAAEKAGTLLSSWDYPSQHIQAIQHAIEAHSYSASIECRTLEAKIVQDADRMDAIGAIGVARTIMVGTALGNPLTYNEDPFCYDRKPDDKLAMVDHFYTKLLHLKDKFHTESAKPEAQRRHQFMLDFLQQLEQEVIE